MDLLNILWPYAAMLAFAYVFGSIPFGFLIGKCKGIDIRHTGSCNIGATNVSRCIGPTYGKLCFFLDFLKGLLPVLLANYFYNADSHLAYLPLVAGAGTILGHMFTCFLHFKGGKGISTAAGAFLGLAPWALLFAFSLWVVIFLSTRYVSLGSIAAATALPISSTVFTLLQVPPPTPVSTQIFIYIIGIVAVFKHRANIKRLLNGTESRFGGATKSADAITQKDHVGKETNI